MIEIYRKKTEKNEEKNPWYPLRCNFTCEDPREIADELYVGLIHLVKFLRGKIEDDIALAKELNRALKMFTVALTDISDDAFYILENYQDDQIDKRQQEELRRAEDECE